MGLTSIQSFLFKCQHYLDGRQINHDFNVLTKLLPEIFPDQGNWKQFIADLAQITNTHQPVARNLPFHTRDNAWLADYVACVARDHNVADDIRMGNIRHFVDKADAFDQARVQYEANLTKGQIAYDLERSANVTSPDYDKDFRRNVLENLAAYGVDQHSAQRAMETHAALWRKPAMVHAFENRYVDPLFGPMVFSRRSMLEEMREHKNTWLRLREYQYYQDHRAIVDEAGSDTANMHITTDQALNLLNQNIKYHQLHTLKNSQTNETVMGK